MLHIHRHRFTNNPELKKKRIIATRRKNFEPTVHTEKKTELGILILN